MEFRFEKFGKAGDGSVRINDLTIICGPNNSGKTYINYAIYSVLKNFRSLFDFGVDEEEIKEALLQLNKSNSVQIDLSNVFSKLTEIKNNFIKIVGPDVAEFFQLPETNFKNTKIFIKIEDIELKNSHHVFELEEGIFCEYKLDQSNSYLTIRLKENGDKKSSEIWKDSIVATLITDDIRSRVFDEYFSDFVPTPFSITSERTGISLFYKAFDYGNKETVRFVNRRIRQNKLGQIKKVGFNLAEAIEDDIDFTRFFENMKSKKSFIVDEKLSDMIALFDKIIEGGTYVSKNNSLYYRPYHKSDEPTIPLESSSSLIKSFFLFDMFIRNFAKKGDILVIDEPELNLHIAKQVEIAHLIARLVNAGVKVLITTHSDYFVREINNLIGLHNSNENYRKELMEEYGILKSDLLKESQVRAYKTGLDEKVQSLDVLKSGIDPDEWNLLIAEENIKSDRIFKLIGT